MRLGRRVVVAVVVALAVVVGCRRRETERREAIAPVPSEAVVLKSPHLMSATSRLSAGGPMTCEYLSSTSANGCWGPWTEVGFGNSATRDSHTFLWDRRGVPVFASFASCELRDDHGVDCWRIESALRTSEKTESPTHVFPAARDDELHVTQLAVNDVFVCALLSDQTVWCWGDNAFGQLGDGTTHDRDVPTQVLGLHDVREVSAGHGHACAVKHGGAVWCWGRNEHGQLGNGTTDDAHAPKLTAIGEAVQVACGEAFSCARRGDGSTMCWGAGKYGQNGDVTLADRTVPTALSIASATRELALGDDFACARGVDDRVRCWGRSDHGQLGRGLVASASALPLDVAPWPKSVIAARVGQIVAGARHACAKLDVEGGSAVACWGAGERGELGDGRKRDSSTPVLVAR